MKHEFRQSLTRMCHFLNIVYRKVKKRKHFNTNIPVSYLDNKSIACNRREIGE